LLDSLLQEVILMQEMMKFMEGFSGGTSS